MNCEGMIWTKRELRGQEGKGGILFLGVVALLIGGFYLISGYMSRRGEREADRLIESNHQELTRVATSVSEAFTHLDSLASHWEVTALRREATVLSNRYDSALEEISRLRSARAVEEDGEAKPSSLPVRDIVARAKLLQSKIQDLSEKSSEQLVTLLLTRQLTDLAVQELGSLEAELDRLGKTITSSEVSNEIYKTRFELLKTGSAQAKTLFKRGVATLTDGDRTGRTVAQAGINMIAQLRSDTAALEQELTERGESGDGATGPTEPIAPGERQG